jgi:hypothetical protein
VGSGVVYLTGGMKGVGVDSDGSYSRVGVGVGVWVEGISASHSGVDSLERSAEHSEGVEM